MEQQIDFIATQVDEEAFLAFLRETTEIGIMEGFADSKEALWVQSFTPELEDHRHYDIWNKAFAWEPKYQQVTQSRKPCLNGKWFVANRHTAPVVQFSRFDPTKGKPGRLYWAKGITAPKGAGYDIDKFGEWYQTVLQWVRDNGKQERESSPYVLPDAVKQMPGS